jgi:hypothetical protein
MANFDRSALSQREENNGGPDKDSGDDSDANREEAQPDTLDLPKERLGSSPTQDWTSATSAGGREIQDLPTSVPYVHRILLDVILIINSTTNFPVSVIAETIWAILNGANESSHPLEAVYLGDIEIEPTSTLLRVDSCE